jgi:hypothetical protein
MDTTPRIANPFGLAIDIDDTIVDTSVACARLLWEEYPLAAFETPMIALQEYGFVDGVPEWKESSPQRIISSALSDPKFLMSLPPILDAQWGVNKISQKIPVACYLTSRLPFAKELTIQWLATYGFPEAPVICRLDHVRDKDWKVRYLQDRLPDTAGLIDNELYVPSDLSYQGQLLEVLRFKKLTPEHPRIVIFNSWKALADHLS